MEPVQKQDVVVSDRPFIPPVQQTTGVTGQKVSCSTTGQLERKKATQPVEAPGAVLATRPVAAVELTGQDASPVAAADRPKVERPGPASSTSTGQAAFDAKKHAASITGSGHQADEPVSDTEPFSDHASASPDEEDEVESAGPDHEELVDVDQELSAEQTCRETMYVPSWFGLRSRSLTLRLHL